MTTEELDELETRATIAFFDHEMARLLRRNREDELAAIERKGWAERSVEELEKIHVLKREIRGHEVAMRDAFVELQQIAESLPPTHAAEER